MLCILGLRQFNIISMEKLSASQQAELKKCSTDRLRAKLLKADYDEELVMKMERADLSTALVELWSKPSGGATAETELELRKRELALKEKKREEEKARMDMEFELRKRELELRERERDEKAKEKEDKIKLREIEKARSGSAGINSNRTWISSGRRRLSDGGTS